MEIFYWNIKSQIQREWSIALIQDWIQNILSNRGIFTSDHIDDWKNYQLNKSHINNRNTYRIIFRSI